MMMMMKLVGWMAKKKVKSEEISPENWQVINFFFAFFRNELNVNEIFFLMFFYFLQQGR